MMNKDGKAVTASPGTYFKKANALIGAKNFLRNYLKPQPFEYTICKSTEYYADCK